MRRLARLAAAALIAGASLAACSDDGSGSGDDGAAIPAVLPPEAEPYLDALAATFAEEGLPMPDDQVRCVATRRLQVYGLERLTEAAIDPDELEDHPDDVSDALGLDEAARFELADAFEHCGFDLYEALRDQIALEAQDPEAFRRCFESTISRAQLRQILADEYTRDDDDGAEIVDGVPHYEPGPESQALLEAVWGCSEGGLGG